MKHLIAIALVACLLVSVAPPQAQAKMGAFATWWDGGNDLSTGFGGGLRYKFKLIPLIALDASASYISFGDVDFSDKSVYTIPLEAIGTLDFGIVYGGLALGYYMWGGGGVDTSNEVGGSILAGVSLGLGGLGVFGELRYNIVKTTLEDVLDVDADGFSINLGVNF